MSTTWIDFRAVKAALVGRFPDVLARYGIETKREGRELTAPCPFHEDDSRPSFKVNVEKGVWHCHSGACDTKGGNLIDFVARKESVTIRRAAELLAEWFSIDAGKNGPPDGKNRAETASPEHEEEPPILSPVGQEPPKALTFTLKLDPTHAYLQERGIEVPLAERLGIGFCSRGIMRGRVCFPLRMRDDAGEVLVGYAGRWPGDPPEGTGKWMLPPSFPKGGFVYGLSELEEGTDAVCLVEGIFSVIRLRERFGIPAVALLGTSLSGRQLVLLEEQGIRMVTLLLDGDRAGRAATEELLPRLARRFFVRVIELPDDGEPDTLPEPDLRQLLGC